MMEEILKIKLEKVTLEGQLYIPHGASSLIVFVHGSGSGRHSPRNQFVAKTLNQSGLATLLFDLLTEEEELFDLRTAALRFNIDLLTKRVVEVTKWLQQNNRTNKLHIGYFGASTGAAAALAASARLANIVQAVVSRGGRPDLAGASLPHVQAATLLIVGENDPVVIKLNQQAFALLSCPKELAIVPHATHLFEEPGTLEQVALLASNWFANKMPVVQPK